MKEKKKVTKLDIAKLILGSTAASGATGIVYYACKAYGPAPKSKLNKIVLTIGAYALAAAAGAAAYKQIESDLELVDVFKAFCKGIKTGIKTGFEKAKEKEDEEVTETPDPPMTDEEIHAWYKAKYGDEDNAETEE